VFDAQEAQVLAEVIHESYSTLEPRDFKELRRIVKELTKFIRLFEVKIGALGAR